MAPYQNTRSGLRSSQHDEQPNEDTHYDSLSRSQVDDEQSSENISGLQVEDEQPCYLLEIHPEIRNEIYRLVLVSKDPIEVAATDTPPMDPPLLRTCSQIRTEARGIFYKENKVNFAVLDYDIRKIVDWLDRSTARHDLFANAQLALSVSSRWVYCWHALLNWAYAYHQGRCGRLTLDSSSIAPNDAHAKEADRLEAIAMFDRFEKRPVGGSLKYHDNFLRNTLLAYHANHMRGGIWRDHPSFPPPINRYYYRYSLGESPSPLDPFGLRHGPLAPLPSAVSMSRNEATPPHPATPHAALRFYKGRLTGFDYHMGPPRPYVGLPFPHAPPPGPPPLQLNQMGPGPPYVGLPFPHAPPPGPPPLQLNQMGPGPSYWPAHRPPPLQNHGVAPHAPPPGPAPASGRPSGCLDSSQKGWIPSQSQDLASWVSDHDYGR
jgi:hypothetical protein